MGEPIDFYVNMLAGNMAGLSAVSALKSLDDAAAKAASGIRSLEGQVEAAKTKLDSLQQTNETVQALTARLAIAKEQFNAMRTGKVAFDPKQFQRASDEVGKLGSHPPSGTIAAASGV